MKNSDSTDILQQIKKRTLEFVAIKKENISTEKIKSTAFFLPRGDFAFKKALKKDGLSFICECKKASPSKGLISENYPYIQIAREYEEAGADCLSVLTEPFWFKGAGRHLDEITSAVSIPCLRKDFTVDEYMIYEATLFGADAVLLICSILSPAQLKEYLDICKELGLSALTEAHDEKDIETALHAGANIIGVNNRNLKDFSVDIENSRRLRALVPKDVLFVAESGIKTADDVNAMREIGADAVLVGEVLMRAKDKKEKLRELK